MTSKPHDLLIAAPSRWDEACFAIPAVRALIASGLGVGVACKESQASLWETISDLQVLTHGDTAKPKTIANSIGTDWEAALLLEFGPAAKAAKSLKIPRRLGAPMEKLSKLLTHPLDITVGPLDHRVRYYMALADAMGVKTLDPNFFKPASLGIDPIKDSILLCPDSDFGSHYEWNLDHWQKLAKQLIADGMHVSIACQESEKNMGTSLHDLLDKANKVQIDPLSTSLPILAKHALVVSADGSLPHLAAHAGATCVTLFGPNDAQWKRPLGKHHGIAKHHVECAPCLLDKCPLDLRCQHELTVDQVLSAIRNKC